MECKEAEKQIVTALWRKSPRDYSEELLSHVSACRSCLRYEAKIKRMVQLIQAAEPPDLSDAFWERLRKTLEDSQ